MAGALSKSAITDLQKQLVAKGYDVGPTGADGIMGDKTRAALKSFQKASGIKADGLVGTQTMDKLSAAAPKVPAPNLRPAPDVLGSGKPKGATPPQPNLRPAPGSDTLAGNRLRPTPAATGPVFAQTPGSTTGRRSNTSPLSAQSTPATGTDRNKITTTDALSGRDFNGQNGGEVKVVSPDGKPAYRLDYPSLQPFQPPQPPAGPTLRQPVTPFGLRPPPPAAGPVFAGQLGNGGGAPPAQPAAPTPPPMTPGPPPGAPPGGGGGPPPPQPNPSLMAPASAAAAGGGQQAAPTPPNDAQKADALSQLRMALQVRQGAGGGAPQAPAAPAAPAGGGAQPAPFTPSQANPGFGLPGLPPASTFGGGVANAGGALRDMIMKLFGGAGGGQPPQSTATPAAPPPGPQSSQPTPPNPQQQAAALATLRAQLQQMGASAAPGQ